MSQKLTQLRLRSLIEGILRERHATSTWTPDMPASVSDSLDVLCDSVSHWATETGIDNKALYGIIDSLNSQVTHAVKVAWATAKANAPEGL